MRLHVLMAPAVSDPEQVIEALLRARGLESRARRVRANLEDVFVMATDGSNP
jgi:predicted RecB family endonuclease